MAIISLDTWPHDPRLVALSGDQTMNGVVRMFEGAYLDTAAHVWLIRTDQAEAFIAAAERRGQIVMDKRAGTRVALPRVPLPLPECAECGQPYKRTTEVEPGDRCVSCSAPLALYQQATLTGADLWETRPCPKCARPVKYGRHPYCRCGEPLPRRPPVDLVPTVDGGVMEVGKIAEEWVERNRGGGF